MTGGMAYEALNNAAKLESKVKEFESAYFDLQMENIQLKDELSKLKR